MSSSGPTPDANRWLTWPNLVTTLRAIGSPGLVVLALWGEPLWLVGLAVALVFTEWLDGFLARGLHEESVMGARLDTVADALFYSSLLAAIFILNPTLVRDEAVWITAAIGSYLCSWLASWYKFRRLPSYHTWAAKAVWVVMGVGMLFLLTGGSKWPFRLAMVCVVLTNLEAVAITFVLPRCRVNVPSLWHVLKVARKEGD